ncbi:kinase-like domain-containing protein [Trichoderma barbatum]
METGHTNDESGLINEENRQTGKEKKNASDELIDNLRDAYVTNPRGGRRFVPGQKLKELCNNQAVAKELARVFPQNDPSTNERLASSICYTQALDTSIIPQPCLKIFAILVLLKQVGLIELFLESQLCDDDLPFSSSPGFKELWARQEESRIYFNFPPGCDVYGIIEGFVEKQWQFLAPHFEAPTTEGMRFNVYEFPEKTIFPIDYISEKKYSGGFGLVEKIKIHSEHNGFKHEAFALKTMHALTPDERDRFFQQELEAFQKVTPGGHIIEICAAIKMGESRGFLFPWAKGGNLNKLWNKPPHAIVASTGVQWSQFSRWICIQCHGIIRDLRVIHGPSDMLSGTNPEALYGIHGDIKPDNILYFSTDGLPLGSLKVSDLGLMKFHRQVSRTMHSHSMGHAYQTYRSPEHERDMGQVRSRKIDIWAFGCLFAELLTWAIGGENAIETFKTERVNEDKHFPDESRGEWSEDNFFIMKTSLLTKSPKRKSSVDKWFTGLIKKLGPMMASTFFPEFLSFIQDYMLHPDRDRRANCKEVEDFLGKLLENKPESPYWHFNGTVYLTGAGT